MTDTKSDHVLPDYVKCYKCGGKPVGNNWLKPVSRDADCRVFIHLGCISPDLLRSFEGHLLC